MGDTHIPDISTQTNKQTYKQTDKGSFSNLSFDRLKHVLFIKNVFIE